MRSPNFQNLEVTTRVQNENFFSEISENEREFSETENSEKYPRIREIIFNVFAVFMADVEAL